jgi:hypothetical protein
VPLDSVGLDRNDLDQCVQGDISDVVVPVRQEFAQYVHTEHAEARVSFNIENGQNCLVKNGVSDIL